MERALVSVLAVLALVGCEALPHELRQLLGVEVTTTGSPPDPDGYVAMVDGDPALSRSIESNGSVTFEGLAPGEHTVVLTGLAENCEVSDGPASRTVTVTEDGIARVTFQVLCTEDFPGSLLVEVRTWGPEPDLDGYALTVDGTVTRPVATDGSVLFDSLTEGEHTVELVDVADACEVEGSSRRSVTVTAEATTHVLFVVSCPPGPGQGPGWLVVQTITTGDVSGAYTVTVDGSASLSKVVGANGSVVFEDLIAGEHSVRLGGLAAGCAVTVPNPQTVTLPPDTLVDVVFTVSCVPPSGSVEVEVLTTGKRIDRDGYIATVDGSATERQAVGPNGSVLFGDLAVGFHSVELSAVASNCNLMVSNPQTFTIAAGVVSKVTFLVSCPSRGGSG